MPRLRRGWGIGSADRGRVDLDCLFASLQAEGLVSAEKVNELKSTFALEAVRLHAHREVIY